MEHLFCPLAQAGHSHKIVLLSNGRTPRGVSSRSPQPVVEAPFPLIAYPSTAQRRQEYCSESEKSRGFPARGLPGFSHPEISGN